MYYTRSSYFPQGPSNLFISLMSGKTHAAYALSQLLKNRGKYLFWVAAPINIQLRFNLHYMHQPGYLSNFNNSFDQTPTPTFILLDIWKCLLAICLSHYFFLRKDKFWELSPHVPFNYWCSDFSNCRKIIIELSVSSIFYHSHLAFVLQSDRHIWLKKSVFIESNHTLFQLLFCHYYCTNC